MFSALKKLRILEQRLEEGRFEEVLALASDPSIRLHRRALTARGAARQRLLERAAGLLSKGDALALQSLMRVLESDGHGPDLIPLKSALEAAKRDLEAAEHERAQAHRQAREHLRRGNLNLALELAEKALVGSDRLAEIRGEVERRRAEAKEHCEKGSKCRDQNDLVGARTHLSLAIENDRQSVELGTLAEGLLQRAEQLPLETLTETLGVVGQLSPKGARLQLSFERVAERHRRGIEDLLSRADFEAAGRALAIYPLGVEADGDAERFSAGLRALRRAEREWGAGNLDAAHQWMEKAHRVLPPSLELASRTENLSRSRAEASQGLRGAREALDAGRVSEARERLLPLLEKQPRHPQLVEFLRILDSHEAEDLRVLSEIRSALCSSLAEELLAAQKILRPLRARRSDLLELAVLERDLNRRIRECGAAPIGQMTPDELWGPSEGPDVSAAPPQVLHVEESGDWLLLDRPRAVLGRFGGPADVPFLAPVAKLHACLERREVGDEMVIDLTAGATQPCYRNGALVEGSVELRHGDLIALGSSVEFRFLRPIADNGTCVLELEGGRDVWGCRRILLLGGMGRRHAIVMGPGPTSHVEVNGGRSARLELIRESSGEAGMNWFARCVSGVSVGGGPERPQVRLAQGDCVRGGGLAFHLSPVAALLP